MAAGMPCDFAFSAMAKRSDRNPAAWRRPFLSWLDGVEAGWAVPLLLACFVAVWTIYLVTAYFGAGLHPDVLETWTFGRHFAWGYAKHPPLMGWVAGAWTTVFPSTDWSLHLMAMTNAALALWFVDLISRRFVTGDKRAIVLLLLMLTPVYQFHAQRFNANSVQLATWPLATYCFLRSFETPTIRWATAAGATAAIALLGKYYSVFLVASFALAALLHPQRRAYFTSASPWISAVTGLAVLGMHLDWLIASDAAPIHHALTHAQFDLSTSLRDSLSFVMGLAAAMAVPAVTWVMTAGTRITRFAEDFAALNDGLRLLFYVAIGSVGLPVVTSLVMGTDLPSLWALQGLFLFAVLVVCGASYRIERFYTVNIAVLVAAIAIVTVTIAAPLHALYRNSFGYEEGRTFYRQVALETTRQWRELTGVPLEHVGGTESLAFATAFYSADHPLYGLPALPSQPVANTSPGAITDHGWVSLCFREQADCIDAAEATAVVTGKYVRREFTVQSRLLGLAGLPRTVVAFLVSPAIGSRGSSRRSP
jgi:4-amino-4-deoxy-L-arabinose transferase-like glycosyltransferase